MEKDHLEILLEDIRGKFDLVLEGHDVLHKEIRDSREELCEKVDLVDFKVDVLDKKIDAVAADLFRPPSGHGGASINVQGQGRQLIMSSPEAIRSQILDLVKEYHTAKFAPKTFDPDKDMVHYAGRVFDAEEIVNLVDADLDFFLTANRYAERFEAECADYLGLSNALLVNSGSSANLVALTTLTSPKLRDHRFKPGDGVLTVACGFPTTLNPILQNQFPWKDSSK